MFNPMAQYTKVCSICVMPKGDTHFPTFHSYGSHEQGCYDACRACHQRWLEDRVKEGDATMPCIVCRERVFEDEIKHMTFKRSPKRCVEAWKPRLPNVAATKLTGRLSQPYDAEAQVDR